MPFHEITRAVCNGPTRAIAQVADPVPTQLSPNPSARRLTMMAVRLSQLLRSKA
ncbi:hypothetical protein D3C71_1530710 [compost metagenome]